jgi:hypothetical protein
MVDSVLRNDEATGSIPVSSTIFPITYEPVFNSAATRCHSDQERSGVFIKAE